MEQSNQPTEFKFVVLAVLAVIGVMLLVHQPDSAGISHHRVAPNSVVQE